MTNDGEIPPVSVKREAEEEANDFKTKLTGKLAEKLDFAFTKLFEPCPDMPQTRVDMLLGQLARKNKLKFEVCEKFYEFRISGKTKKETIDLLKEQGLSACTGATKIKMNSNEKNQTEGYIEGLINPPDWTESLMQAVEEAVLADTVEVEAEQIEVDEPAENAGKTEENNKFQEMVDELEQKLKTARDNHENMKTQHDKEKAQLETQLKRSKVSENKLLDAEKKKLEAQRNATKQKDEELQFKDKKIGELQLQMKKLVAESKKKKGPTNAELRQQSAIAQGTSEELDTLKTKFENAIAFINTLTDYAYRDSSIRLGEFYKAYNLEENEHLKDRVIIPDVEEEDLEMDPFTEYLNFCEISEQPYNHRQEVLTEKLQKFAESHNYITHGPTEVDNFNVIKVEKKMLPGQVFTFEPGSTLLICGVPKDKPHISVLKNIYDKMGDDLHEFEMRTRINASRFNHNASIVKATFRSKFQCEAAMKIFHRFEISPGIRVRAARMPIVPKKLYVGGVERYHRNDRNEEMEPYTEQDYTRVLLLDRPESGFESMTLGTDFKPYLFVTFKNEKCASKYRKEWSKGFKLFNRTLNADFAAFNPRLDNEYSSTVKFEAPVKMEASGDYSDSESNSGSTLKPKTKNSATHSNFISKPVKTFASQKGFNAKVRIENGEEKGLELFNKDHYLKAEKDSEVHISSIPANMDPIELMRFVMQHGAIIRAYIPMNSDRTLTGEAHLDYVKNSEAASAVRSLNGYSLKGATISVQKQSERVQLEITCSNLYLMVVSKIRFDVEKIAGDVRRIAKIKPNKVCLTYQTYEKALAAEEGLSKHYPNCGFAKKAAATASFASTTPPAQNKVPTGSAWGRTQAETANNKRTTPRDYSDFDNKRSRY